LHSAGIKTSGAGNNLEEATTPAVVEVTKEQKKTRVLIFSYGTPSAGVPFLWAAGPTTPGVAFLHLQLDEIDLVRDQIAKYKKPGDIVVLSMHWGANVGFELENFEREFAHLLIDVAHVDVVLGHSSHHVIGLEVWHNKLILYGAGDFISDYEGIVNPLYEGYRLDLGLMYFPEISTQTGELKRLVMVPTCLKNLRVSPVSQADASFLFDVLNKEGEIFGNYVNWTNSPDMGMELTWY